MVRTQRLVVALATILIIALITVIGWWLWVSPKGEFSCDSRNGGAPTPESAATSFIKSLAARDAEAACRTITNKIGVDELQMQLDWIWQRLGQPTDPSEIDVTIGLQSGNTFPLTLEGPSGTVDLNIMSFLDWYRVTLQ